MKAKQVMKLIPASTLPPGTKIYPAVVNWTTNKVLGVYFKTKCRICFGGHQYNKTYTDCFAPTVNFTSVLIILCLASTRMLCSRCPIQNSLYRAPASWSVFASARRLRIRSGIVTLCFSGYIHVAGTLCFAPLLVTRAK